jgi:hypothetical protein
LVPSEEKYASAFCPPNVSCCKFWKRVSRAPMGGKDTGSGALTKRELTAINHPARTRRPIEVFIIDRIVIETFGKLYLNRRQMSSGNRESQPDLWTVLGQFKPLEQCFADFNRGLQNLDTRLDDKRILRDWHTDQDDPYPSERGRG